MLFDDVGIFQREIIDDGYTFRYIGSKTALLPYIRDVIFRNIDKQSNNLCTFCDLFAGTGIVSRYFKQWFNIISNDILYFSFVLLNALVYLEDVPSFEHLKTIKLNNRDKYSRTNELLHYLESLPGKEGFVYSNYSPASANTLGYARMYFSERNAKKIDAIRDFLDILLMNEEITMDEFYYLLSSLLFAIQRIANISGTYGAYNKNWDRRSLKSLVLPFIKPKSTGNKVSVYNMDVFALLSQNEVNCDIAYIDPPYNGRQYISNYHVIETIARNDKPKLAGKTGIRHDAKNFFSSFSRKSEVISSFKRLFLLLYNKHVKYIALSYNSEGLLSLEDIKILLNEAGYMVKDVGITKYRRFKSNSRSMVYSVDEYIMMAVRV